MPLVPTYQAPSPTPTPHTPPLRLSASSRLRLVTPRPSAPLPRHASVSSRQRLVMPPSLHALGALTCRESVVDAPDQASGCVGLSWIGGWCTRKLDRVRLPLVWWRGGGGRTRSGFGCSRPSRIGVGGTRGHDRVCAQSRIGGWSPRGLDRVHRPRIGVWLHPKRGLGALTCSSSAVGALTCSSSAVGALTCSSSAVVAPGSSIGCVDPSLNSGDCARKLDRVRSPAGWGVDAPEVGIGCICPSRIGGGRTRSSFWVRWPVLDGWLVHPEA